MRACLPESQINLDFYWSQLKWPCTYTVCCPSWGASLLLLFKPSLNARVGALGWNCILRHFSAQSIPTTLHHPPPPFPIAHLTLAPPSSPVALSPICAANWRRPPLVLVRFPNQHASWQLEKLATLVLVLVKCHNCCQDLNQKPCKKAAS